MRSTIIEVQQDSTQKFKVVIPMVPNFIKCGDTMQSLSHFSERQLRLIGEAWTERLIARAAEMGKDGWSK